MLYLSFSWEASNRRIWLALYMCLFRLQALGRRLCLLGHGVHQELEHTKWASLNIWRVGLPSGTVWRTNQHVCLGCTDFSCHLNGASHASGSETRQLTVCFYPCLYPVKKGVSFTPNCCLASIWTGSICLCHSVGIAISFFKLPPRLSCLQYKFKWPGTHLMASARLNIRT